MKHQLLAIALTAVGCCFHQPPLYDSEECYAALDRYTAELRSSFEELPQGDPRPHFLDEVTGEHSEAILLHCYDGIDS